jgi:predicted SnoaL-like aldol condensation-catalyzing enzyme
MSLEENKRVARLYHEFKPEDIDHILTPDFVGHSNNPGSGFDWNREAHRRFWSNEQNQGIGDLIHELIAEGEFVALRCTRAGTYQGKEMQVEMMRMMRFEDGKIAEIWEYADPAQMEA